MEQRLTDIVNRYFLHRKYIEPTAEQALLFFLSEVGELALAYRLTTECADPRLQHLLVQFECLGLEADDLVSAQAEWVRNHDRVKQPDLEDEIGDVLSMLTKFSGQAVGTGPDDCMLAKFRKKGWPG